MWPTVVSLALGAQIPTYLHTHMTMSCPRAHSLDRAKGRHGEPEKINCAMQFWSFEIGSASLTPKLCTCKCDTIFRLHLALFGSYSTHIRKDCPIVQEKSPRICETLGAREIVHFILKSNASSIITKLFANLCNNTFMRRRNHL